MSAPITTPIDLFHVERGSGPPVLLVGGLGDTHAAWQAQLDGLADRYRLIAPDNRGAGRSPAPPESITIQAMADDAAALLASLGTGPVHAAGFSGGGAIVQELALRHPALVRSVALVSTWCRGDEYLRRMFRSWTWMASVADDEGEMLNAFLLWVYTRRAHADGTVDRMAAAALAEEHPQPADAFIAWAEACAAHDTADRIADLRVPALVVAGEEDIICPPRFSEELAVHLPDARLVVLPGEAHQPFQESPERFNALVRAFWSEVEERAS